MARSEQQIKEYMYKQRLKDMVQALRQEAYDNNLANKGKEQNKGSQ
jgi:hypothetical protein